MEKETDFDDIKLWTVFNQASEAGIKVIDSELFRSHEMSYIQLSVMYIIKTSKKLLSPSEISRILLREPHTTAALINRMQKHGLVMKTRDPRMKNIKRILLTRKGEDFYAKASKEEIRPQLLACLSQEEKEFLLACSEKIRDEALKQLTVRRIWDPLFGADDIHEK